MKIKGISKAVLLLALLTSTSFAAGKNVNVEFRMSTMNCYNITIPYGRIPVAFLRSVKSRRGIFCRGDYL